MAETYDYIVTGAGSAGCVVARRLAEDGRYRVLLLEAGPPDKNPWIHIPLGYAKTYIDSNVNWKFETEPQPQMNGRKLYLPRGKTLGGSSSINGMVYIRGHHADYDEWRQRGCTGWDWDSVLPYFKKAENQVRGADEFHGTGGPLHVNDQAEQGELSHAVLDACEQAGIPRNPDFNGKVQEGCGYYQTTTSNKRRWSAAKAYLSNPPKTLTIRTGAHATKVLIENNRATGVEFHTAAGRQTARAQAGGDRFRRRLWLAAAAAIVGAGAGGASARHGHRGHPRHAGGRIEPARSFQHRSKLALHPGEDAERIV